MDKKIIIIISAIIILIVLAVTIFFVINSNNIWKNENKNISSDFKIVFTENKDIGKKKIISKNAFKKDTYDVYLYNGEVKVIIDNKEYNLYDAIQSNKITLQDFIDKAKKEAKSSDSWDDGGSTIYVLDNFKIIKYNTINSNNDLYIGSNYLNYSIGEK